VNILKSKQALLIVYAGDEIKIMDEKIAAIAWPILGNNSGKFAGVPDSHS